MSFSLKKGLQDTIIFWCIGEVFFNVRLLISQQSEQHQAILTFIHPLLIFFLWKIKEFGTGASDCAIYSITS
jgi:hypothetical protein